MNTLIEYKCPCCGGAIAFDSASQKLKCQYCDTEFEPDALLAYDAALKEETSDQLNWNTGDREVWQDAETEGLRAYVCESCGGEIIAEETTAAMSCPFCGNPVIMAGNLSGMIKPDCVIPFQLDQKAAKEALLLHTSSKKLLPKLFKSENKIAEIKGIYVPFWLYDADADADIRYRTTTTRTWEDSKYRYTETSHYLVTRKGEISFESIPADASQKMDDALMDSLEPYDFSKAVDFQTAYLAGYLADKYDVDADHCAERANARAKSSTERAFADTVKDYDSVTVEASHVRLKNSRVRYALLPVWMLRSTWQGKEYTFAMNGQTGKFVGDLPLDRGAYWRWIGIFTAIFGALAFAAIWFFMQM